MLIVSIPLLHLLCRSSSSTAPPGEVEKTGSCTDLHWIFGGQDTELDAGNTFPVELQVGLFYRDHDLRINWVLGVLENIQDQDDRLIMGLCRLLGFLKAGLMPYPALIAFALSRGDGVITEGKYSWPYLKDDKFKCTADYPWQDLVEMALWGAEELIAKSPRIKLTSTEKNEAVLLQHCPWVMRPILNQTMFFYLEEWMPLAQTVSELISILLAHASARHWLRGPMPCSV